ncbi:YifB family Mg chelatase-like AAA ATPase [Candidatus Parcubacteria bacterium]|nr:YifB family Mg chelatase-like AAA ATPase [Candidatus Parcubacteria bacterium]
MIFSNITSAQPNLLGANKINIETDITRGLHSFSIVGLPDKSVEESRDRVSSAIRNSGFDSPKQQNYKITISLSPANLKKSGSIFDLAIALGYLKSSEQIKFNPKGKIFVGELSLDGKVKKINGILQILIFAKKNNFKEIYIPEENIKEAKLVFGIKIYPVKNLGHIVGFLTKKININPLNNNGDDFKKQILEAINPTNESQNKIDFSQIKGNENAKRVLLISACGGHNVCLYGPPGTGKTLLSKAFHTILPTLDYEKIIESTSIHSMRELENNLIINPPFRSPHHTASYSAIIGGGRDIKPGEITLAHNGILFMDEFPEFDRKVINSLRQPMEDKKIKIARSNEKVEYPCDFQLLITMNPCPCGFKNSPHKECKCSTRELGNYRKKLSGPIEDRIDMFCQVSKVSYKKLLEKKVDDKNSDQLKRIVKKIRETQLTRQNKLNNELNNQDIKAMITKNDLREFNEISEKLNLSARAYFKILKVARTISDLENCHKIKIPHILEALQYKNSIYY